jgi:hypothetical protein
MLEARKRKSAGPERRFRLTDRSILTRTLGTLTHASTSSPKRAQYLTVR